MITGIHFLLTYQCTYECDHCFVYASPGSEGTFTVDQLKDVFSEIDKIKTIEWVYFEGGEPFLFYPLMLEGMKMAKKRKLKIGVVTNCYWANSIKDAEVWLKPLKKYGVEDLSMSNDQFHQEDLATSPVNNAVKAAAKLKIPSATIAIEPACSMPDDSPQHKGEPVVGGDVRFRGRAVDKLTEGVPRVPASSFTTCPYEELESPERVHVDPYGNVQVCQGISIGNFWKQPLSKILGDYKAKSHPICGPLLRGGPLELARTYGVSIENSYIDACHFCYTVRKNLIGRFPEELTPRQVYGLK